jgi:hypothetical protein
LIACGIAFAVCEEGGFGVGEDNIGIVFEIIDLKAYSDG